MKLLYSVIHLLFCIVLVDVPVLAAYIKVPNDIKQAHPHSVPIMS